MDEPKEPPIVQVAEQVYRWKETSKLSMRLAYVMSDLLTEVNHFCQERGIEVSDGMDDLMEQVQGLLTRIKETQTLPLADLLRRPPTTLFRQPTLDRDDSDPDQPSSGQNPARGSGKLTVDGSDSSPC